MERHIWKTAARLLLDDLEEKKMFRSDQKNLDYTGIFICDLSLIHVQNTGSFFST
jgi:hypothetical protein